MVEEEGTPLVLRAIEVDAAFCRFNARRSTDPRDPKLEERVFGRAVGFRDRSRHDTFYYNRILLTDESDLPALQQATGWYHEAGIACGVEAPAPVLAPDGWRQLEAMGFRRAEVVAFHHLALTDLQALPSSSALHYARLAGPADVEAVLDLFEAEYSDAAAPPRARELSRDAQIDPAFPIFLVEEAGRAVAMGTAFLHAGISWLGNAFTLPEHRGKGIQMALLQHRLQHAAALGCTDALADVSAGTTSQRNVVRVGMGLAFETLRWTLPVP